MAWGKAGSTTKSSAGTGLSISSLTASDTNLVLTHQLSSTNVSPEYRLDSNSNTDYAYRKSNNGGADGTVTSDNNAQIDSNGGNNDKFAIIYFCNVDGEEKLAISSLVDRNTAGAGNAPNRTEGVSKVDTTTNTGQFTAIDVETGGSAIGADSIVSVLGSEITPADAVPAINNVQDNSLFIEKENARRYWSSGYSPANTPTYETDFSTDPTISSNDTGNNYYDSTNDRWYIQWDWDNTNDAGSIDLYSKIGNQNLSDSNWIIRFKYTIVSQNFTSGSDSKQFFVGLTSTDYSNAFWYPDSSNVSTNFGFYMDKSGTYQLYTNNNSTYSGGTWTNTSRSISNETLYVELIRENSTTAKMNLYSDSTYSTLLVGVSLTIDSGLTGLRYLSVKGMRYNSGASITSNMDDLEIYNNMTNVDTVPATWINEFGVSDGLMFGGISTSSYADYSDSQSWNGVSWTAGGSLTGARQNGASAGTGSTSARYVNGYNASPAPYPNSNRNESYNGTSWTSDTVHPDSVNNKLHGGCGTADSMLVSGGHKNGTGDINNYYKWTGSWTSITASGVSGAVSTSGTVNSALLTKTTSAKTWNGTSWSTSTATSTSRNTASKSGISSSSGIRLFDWANTNPFNNTSEIWNGTSWSASGNTPSGRTDAGEIDNTTESMMTLGGQESYGGTTHSTTVYELRKGVFTTGTSFSNSRRACGGAGS